MIYLEWQQFLTPQIHFIDSEIYSKSAKMENKIKLLRSKIFNDDIKNPLLKNYDINKVETSTEKQLELKIKNEKIQEQEELILNTSINNDNKLKYLLIKNNVINFYKNSSETILSIQNRIESYKNDTEYQNNNIIDKLYTVFIKDLDESISDYEIKRLKNEQARNFYKLFLRNTPKPLHEKIIQRSTVLDKCYYIGETFGEIKHPTRFYENPKDVYVNLTNKEDKYLINLSVVKICLEEDFVNYKLNNFFNLMLDLDLISTDEYNETVLGTTSPNKIKLINLGLSINMVNRLEEDGQLENITYDSLGNLIKNESIKEYLNSLDEFTKFRFEKVFI